MIGRRPWANWDGVATHRHLAELSLRRARFRFERMLERLRSPRRIVASLLAAALMLLYLANGVFILSARAPADPEKLRLWLSGGMVVYAIYHALRCAWSRSIADVQWSAAESLYLGGAPVRRSSLAIYHIGSLAIAAALKTLLLAVVLAVDVHHWELLCLGIFSSLLLLEIVRLMIARWSASIDDRGRLFFRVGVTAVAAAMGIQVVARIFAVTPSGSATSSYVIAAFGSLGELAASDTVQWLSLPWIPSAQLTVTGGYQWMTVLQALAAVLVLPLAITMLVRLDARTLRSQARRERQRLDAGDYRTRDDEANGHVGRETHDSIGFPFANLLPAGASAFSAIASRQWISIRRYIGTIGFSFAVPTVLCLSPLATGRIDDQWFFVIGGIALCTVLLAPPALRLDFRRDLKRMALLRSMPVRPLSMVLGQIAIPILITCLFQWFTIGVAAAVTRPGLNAVVMWIGMLNALAIFTFAIENALFLAYPHHERAEGIAMMLRAKLTFLGKAGVLLAAMALLLVWAKFCTAVLPAPFAQLALVAGGVSGAWTFAAIAIAMTTWCWRRFDLSLDLPPE